MSKAKIFDLSYHDNPRTKTGFPGVKPSAPGVEEVKIGCAYKFKSVIDFSTLDDRYDFVGHVTEMNENDELALEYDEVVVFAADRNDYTDAYLFLTNLVVYEDKLIDDNIREIAQALKNIGNNAWCRPVMDDRSLIPSPAPEVTIGIETWTNLGADNLKLVVEKEIIDPTVVTKVFKNTLTDEEIFAAKGTTLPTETNLSLNGLGLSISDPNMIVVFVAYESNKSFIYSNQITSGQWVDGNTMEPVDPPTYKFYDTQYEVIDPNIAALLQ